MQSDWPEAVVIGFFIAVTFVVLECVGKLLDGKDCSDRDDGPRLW